MFNVSVYQHYLDYYYAITDYLMTKNAKIIIVEILFTTVIQTHVMLYE